MRLGTAGEWVSSGCSRSARDDSVYEPWDVCKVRKNAGIEPSNPPVFVPGNITYLARRFQSFGFASRPCDFARVVTGGMAGSKRVVARVWLVGAEHMSTLT